MLAMRRAAKTIEESCPFGHHPGRVCARRGSQLRKHPTAESSSERGKGDRATSGLLRAAPHKLHCCACRICSVYKRVMQSIMMRRARAPRKPAPSRLRSRAQNFTLQQLDIQRQNKTLLDDMLNAACRARVRASQQMRDISRDPCRQASKSLCKLGVHQFAVANLPDSARQRIRNKSSAGPRIGLAESAIANYRRGAHTLCDTARASRGSP